jgi:predicted enzyme related to lactoylglutathione lyase
MGDQGADAMSDTPRAEVGSITWTDLTVPDAEAVGRFYSEVAGWRSEPVDMGGYSDFNMLAPGSGRCVAGICHARGGNAGLPAQWLVYVTVADVEASAARCRELGGEVLVEPKGMGGMGRMCVVRDPAGAVAALFQPA